jgi:hypothetical protein
MDRSIGSTLVLTLLSLMTLNAVGCSKPPVKAAAAENKPNVPATSSSLETVNLPHTSVKWQSIGNCWAYAAIGWVESMMLRNEALGQPNFSETYITYRHYELQLTDTSLQELQTGGSFQEAAEITARYGLINEGDFAPEEANASKSERQKKATNYLNESLKTGILSQTRNPNAIRAELDTAFGVKLDLVKDKIISASSINVGVGRGAVAPLDEVMLSWREVYWPVAYEDYPDARISKPRPQWNGEMTDAQIRVMRRVMRAMNANYPVVINWFVDFRAMDQKGMFGLKTLAEYQGSGRQGYHSTVLEDYVAEGIDPMTNLPFETPEGETTDEAKSLAARFGMVKSLIVKNSWGGSERIDRPSYQRDGEKGYHKLGIDYLLAFLPRYEENSDEFQGYTTGVNGFLLPPGF